MLHTAVLHNSGVHCASGLEHPRICTVPTQREPADEQRAAAGQHEGGSGGPCSRAGTMGCAVIVSEHVVVLGSCHPLFACMAEPWVLSSM